MIPTGKINPITGEEILKAEHHDVPWEKDWDELSDAEKCNFLSYQDIQFLGEINEKQVQHLYERFQKLDADGKR